MGADSTLYRALFRLGNDPVLVIEDGRVVDANAGAQAVFGEARDALVGCELLDLSAPVQADGRASVEAVAVLTETALPGLPRRVRWLFQREHGPFCALVHVQGLGLGERRLLSLSWRMETGSTTEDWAGRREPSVSPVEGRLGKGRAEAPSRGATSTENKDALGPGRGTDGLPPHSEAVPIDVGGAAIGALGVYGDPQAPLTGEDRQLLESIARQASEALQRARLLEEARERARRERLIRDIADDMQRATDLETLIRVAAEGLARALGATRAYVRMGLPEALVEE